MAYPCWQFVLFVLAGLVLVQSCAAASWSRPEGSEEVTHNSTTWICHMNENYGQGQCNAVLVSLARLSHSQERVWYVTVQLIVLADSGCRVYTRSRSTQTTYTFGGKHPTKVLGSGTNRCIVKYQTLS